MDTTDDFDEGFNNMMSSAIEYERLRREGKPISESLQRRMEEAGDWLSELSDEAYSSLIH